MSYYDETFYEDARRAIKELRNEARSLHESLEFYQRESKRLDGELKVALARIRELEKFEAAYEALSQE